MSTPRDNVIVPNVELTRTRNRPALISKARPCPISCGSLAASACTRAICPAIRIARLHPDAGVHGGKLFQIGFERHTGYDHAISEWATASRLGLQLELGEATISFQPCWAMIVITQPNATEEQIERIVARVREFGLDPQISRGASRVIISVIGPEDSAGKAARRHARSGGDCSGVEALQTGVARNFTGRPRRLQSAKCGLAATRTSF